MPGVTSVPDAVARAKLTSVGLTPTSPVAGILWTGFAPSAKAKAGFEVVEFISHSAEQTRHIGATLARLVQPGDIIWLQGDLGAGKTTFTKGLAEGLGVTGYVNSPTFTLVNEYAGRLPIFHLDCYRLESGREALDFGLEEYLYGDGLTIIEWPERIQEVLPPDGLRLYLAYLSENERTFRLEAFGGRYEAMAQAFSQELELS